MASVSASHLILFIASMVIAASVAGVFTDTVGRLSQAVSDQGLDVSQDVRSDVEIISDSGSAGVYDGGVITLYVKNTGSSTLPAEPGAVDLFVDGAYTTGFTLETVDDDVQWRPGGVVEIEVTQTLSSGDHRIKLIVNGDEEVFEFRT